MTCYFLDTEFVDDGSTIMPISLGLLCEDGRELYIEFEFDVEKARAHDFVRENVLPSLTGDFPITREQARTSIVNFMRLDHRPLQRVLRRTPPQVWAYYADYDWVLFCQIFGPMVDLPDVLPKFCMDLQQWWVQLGRPEGVKPPKSVNAHNALADANWNKKLHGRLERYTRWAQGGVGRDPTGQWELEDQ